MVFYNREPNKKESKLIQTGANHATLTNLIPKNFSFSANHGISSQMLVLKNILSLAFLALNQNSPHFDLVGAQTSTVLIPGRCNPWARLLTFKLEFNELILAQMAAWRCVIRFARLL
jgi:hypothetical protein